LKYLLVVTIFTLIMISQSYSTDFSLMAKKLLEESPEVLIKKLEYESSLKEKNESEILSARLSFNESKCQELEKLISIIYDYNISLFESKKYTLLINLRMSSTDTSESVDKPLDILKHRLRSLERKKEYLIESLKILTKMKNIESLGLVDLENVDMSIVFLDIQSLLNMSDKRRLLELKKTNSVRSILESSIDIRNLKLELMRYSFKLKDSFDLLNLYKSIHNEFLREIEKIENRYKSKEISNEEYIKSQLHLINLKIKLLDQEKTFILNFLNMMKLLGLDVEKHLFE